jgi:drug/metabolite transporter (DMT)-like permease
MIEIALIVSFLGLLAAVLWGTADFFAAKSTKALSPELAALVIGFIIAIIFSLFYVFRSGNEPWFVDGVLFAIGAGVFLGAGLLVFYRGLDAGPVSIVSPISSAYPLITAIIALAVFGEKISQLQLLGIILIIVGIIGASGMLRSHKSERRLTKGVAYGFLTFVLWGLAFALLGEAVSKIGWEKTTLVHTWFSFLTIAVLVLLIKSRQKFSFTKEGIKIVLNKYLFIAALTQLFAVSVFNIGLSLSESTAIITAISATYPVLTIFLALKHFKEKISLIPMLGAVVTIIGVVILSF